MTTSIEPERCANCGNRARVVVSVEHPRIKGKWLRQVCSRMCGAIQAELGKSELVASVGGAEPDAVRVDMVIM